MPTERATALVVRGTDWSETSRIVTLFTREFGKVRALAKGGRRLKSNFEVALDLLNVCEVAFIRKATDGLDLLTEARVAERFPALRAELPALYAGYYVAELLADGTHDYDPHPGLFDVAVATLRGLATRADEERGRGGGVEKQKEGATHTSDAPPLPFSSPPALLAGVSHFELAWLRELGYSPRLDACAGCERELITLDAAARLGYSPHAGGVLCPSCVRTVRDHRPLTRTAWEAVRELAAGAGAVAVGREVRQVLGQTVGFVLGRRPRLLGYVDG